MIAVEFHRIGFNRPENLWKDFTIEAKTETTSTRGRAKESYGEKPPIFIHAILCGATPEQKLQYQQMEHPISHVISHEGKPKAKEGDRLILKDRAFYVQGVDDPGDLGIWTLYYCEERSDTHDGNQLPTDGG